MRADHGTMNSSGPATRPGNELKTRSSFRPHFGHFSVFSKTGFARGLIASPDLRRPYQQPHREGPDFSVVLPGSGRSPNHRKLFSGSMLYPLMQNPHHRKMPTQTRVTT